MRRSTKWGVPRNSSRVSEGFDGPAYTVSTACSASAKVIRLGLQPAGCGVLRCSHYRRGGYAVRSDAQRIRSPECALPNDQYADEQKS